MLHLLPTPSSITESAPILSSIAMAAQHTPNIAVGNIPQFYIE